MTLENVADKITCPLLIVHGENDRQIPLWHAEKTYAAAVNSQDRELKIFHLADGGAEHCGADNGPLDRRLHHRLGGREAWRFPQGV